VGRNLYEEERMKNRRKTKYIHEGEYVAAVEIELLEDETGWSPYMSLEDAYKLDDVRDALRKRDVRTAGRFGDVFRMEPVDVQT
jgi:hypothetical protein